MMPRRREVRHGRWPLPDDVSGLALSEDGARLCAALGGRVTVVDTDTGDATTTLAFGGIESILQVTNAVGPWNRWEVAPVSLPMGGRGRIVSTGPPTRCMGRGRRPRCGVGTS